jgi:hypothetical protein
MKMFRALHAYLSQPEVCFQKDPLSMQIKLSVQVLNNGHRDSVQQYRMQDSENIILKTIL